MSGNISLDQVRPGYFNLGQVRPRYVT